MMFHLLYETTLLRLGKVAIYSNAQKKKKTELKKVMKEETIF